MTRLHGGSGEIAGVADLVDGMPVITDAPDRARDALAAARVHRPILWDILELATLLVPRCPQDSLDRATEFFGIKVEGSGLARQVECMGMLFELLLLMVEQLESHTLLHIRRLAAGLDWGLAELFEAVLRNRELSSLETGVL